MDRLFSPTWMSRISPPSLGKSPSPLTVTCHGCPFILDGRAATFSRGKMGTLGIGGSESHTTEYSSLVRYFMEAELFKAISDIRHLQWFTVVLLMAAVLLSMFAGFLASYAKKKGE